jgi:hypothetical protein
MSGCNNIGGLELLLSGDATLIWGLLFSAWGTVFIAVLTGNGNWLHADALTAHPYWGIGANALTFIFAWLVMTVAMMLPTSLPLIQLFAKVDSRPWLIQLPPGLPGSHCYSRVPFNSVDSKKDAFESVVTLTDF